MGDASSATRMEEWNDTLAKRILARIALPILYLMNRPSLARFNRATFDFALRCNGFGINFKGAHGLTVGEEKFLQARMRGVGAATLFDVGANHGAYTRYLEELAPRASIYAFEPHPLSFAALTGRPLSANTTVVNKALSDAPGRLTLHDFATSDGSTQASLSRDALELFTTSVVEHEVEVTTLDDFIDQHGIGFIDLLKIDTEGFDLAVLKGASRALQAGRIGLIQFEFIPANIVTGVRMRDFIGLLKDHTVHRLCLNGELLPLTPYDVKRVEVYAMQNLIAVPNRARAP